MQHFQGTSLHRYGLVMPSLIIALALVCCAIVASTTILRVKSRGQTIRVTGASFKPIRSDFAVWEAEVSVSDSSLTSAYKSLADDMEKVLAFLLDAGFGPGACELGTIRIGKKVNRERQVIGFDLSRIVRVELADVDRIGALSGEASTLIENGVRIQSRSPKYLCTNLDTLKIAMIRAATENAKLRAEELARSTGRAVGAPISARVGVFQIRPRYSQDVSGMGISDVSSVEKEIVSTVQVGFLIE